MTTENNTLTQQQITPEIVSAELVLTLSKEGLAYQQLLQDSENVVFTKDNINEERSALINLRKVKKKLEDAENPFTDRWKNWNSARKSLVDPVVELLTRKEGEFRLVSREIEEENRKAEAEKQRKAGILSEIDNFFINQSQAIAAATEPGELVRIEKLIGSHKSAARYGEFLPLMAQKASNLTELIKVQKEAIKILEGLKRKEMAAEAKGDDETVLAMREQQETISAGIEQAKIDVQEVSIKMATAPDVVEPEIIVPVAPKARRSAWTYDILDIKKLQKVMPDWVELVVKTDKINEYLKAKKAEGIEGESFAIPGIRFFIEKSY